MKRSVDDYSPYRGNQPVPGFAAEPDRNSGRSEPVLGNLYDDEDGYDEPERDTDAVQGMSAEHIDEDDTLDDFLPEEYQDDSERVFAAQSALLASAAPGTTARAPRFAATSRDQDDDWDDTRAQGGDEWDDESDDVDESGRPRWPLGPILVGAVAVLLLVAGVYGVLQQRSATEQEIRELQAALATANGAGSMDANRLALQELKDRHAQLEADASVLRGDNARLTDTVAGLEAQLAALAAAKPAPVTPAPAKPASTAQQPAAAQPSAPQPSAAQTVATAATPPQPVAAPSAATKPSAAAAANGRWFVNFGSYGQRAIAQRWADQLQPGAGRVVVSDVARDGSTLYRVRVVGLADRSAAENVARKLESSHGLPKLWVGQE